MKNEIREQRVIALTVPCTYCGAPEYQECLRPDGIPLVNLPAHYRRIKDAEERTPF
jgi:hypothetical protein